MSSDTRASDEIGATADRFVFPGFRTWNLDGRQTAILAGVLLVTAAVYLRCLANGFVFDDVPTIIDNKYIGQWSYIWKYSFTRDLWWFSDPKQRPITAAYRPLQNVWIGIAYHLFGRNPVGWHVLKIALHLVTVTICFRVAQLLTRSTSAGLFAALLFGMMPIHAEPVVWAVELPEALSSAFELGALCLFIQRSRTRWPTLAWPLILFAGALLSHESAVVFPLLIAAYVVLLEMPERAQGSSPMGPPRPYWRTRAATAWSAPFFGLSVLYLGTRAMVLGTGGVFGLPKKQFTSTATAGRITFQVQATAVNHTIGQIFSTIPAALLRYLKLLVFPWPIGPGQSLKIVTVPSLENFYLPIAALVLLAFVGWLLSRKLSDTTLYLFCALWWLVTLAPAMDFNQLWIPIGERYEYLPSFGFCLIAGDWAVALAHTGAAQKWVVTVLGTAAAFAYAGIIWAVQPMWHDNLSYFERCVQNSPNVLNYRMALTEELITRGDYKGAEHQLVSAVDFEPSNPAVHLALAGVYAHENLKVEANREFGTFLRLQFGHPLPGVHTSTPVKVAPPSAKMRK